MAVEKPDELSIPDLLKESDTVVIIGCSDKPYRTSYHIAEYLQRVGYRIIPVNPKLNGKEVLGEISYDSVKDLPEDLKVDIMVIFRNRQHSAEAVGEIAEWSEKTGQKPIVWTQLDVSSEEAEEIARKADLGYVRNRCIHADHSYNFS